MSKKKTHSKKSKKKTKKVTAKKKKAATKKATPKKATSKATPKTAAPNKLIHEMNAKLDRIESLLQKVYVSINGSTVAAPEHTNTTNGAAYDNVATDLFPETQKTAKSKATIEDVTQALQEVIAEKGQPAAVEIINSFGASKVSEIKSKDFAKVIKACSGAGVLPKEETTDETLEWL